jgi:hypothetical protein
MKYLNGLVAAALVLVLAPAPGFAQSGPAGDWELAMTTPQGTTTVALSLKVDGDKVTGQMSNAMGPVAVAGTTAGEALTLNADINIQGMALTFVIAGKVIGDTMDGSVKVGDFGEFPFTGKRAGAASAATAAAAPAAVPAGPITDLNGKWDIKLAIAGMGEIPATAVMKQEGDKITGTLSGPAGDLVIAGTVTGKSVKIDFEAETPQGKLPVTMTGDIGDTSVSGKASIAGLGEADWTATRAVQ